MLLEAGMSETLKAVKHDYTILNTKIKLCCNFILFPWNTKGDLSVLKISEITYFGLKQAQQFYNQLNPFTSIQLHL